MKFDMDTYKKVFEARDVDRILEFYSTDLDHIEIDQEAPPKSPRKSGFKDIREAFEQIAQSGIKLRIDNPVVGPNSAACTIVLDFPDNRQLISNTIYDIKDGKIVRQRDVAVTDPES